jgi:hypothetical protein
VPATVINMARMVAFRCEGWLALSYAVHLHLASWRKAEEIAGKP